MASMQRSLKRRFKRWFYAYQKRHSRVRNVKTVNTPTTGKTSVKTKAVKRGLWYRFKEWVKQWLI